MSLCANVGEYCHTSGRTRTLNQNCIIFIRSRRLRRNDALGHMRVSDSRCCFGGGACSGLTKRTRGIVTRASSSREQYPRFYYTNNDYGLEKVDAGCIVQLDAEETRHACTVLRLQPGDRLEVCDGRGNVVECEMMQGASERKGKRGSKQVASVVVRDWVVRCGEDGTAEGQQGRSMRWSVAIACGSLKGGRGDWVVEKCAELGATDFIPLLTERSPKLGRSNGREDRWERIAFAAMKQSLGVYAMKVHEPVQSVQDFVDQYLHGIVCSSMTCTDTEGSNFSNNDEKDERSTEKRMCALMGAQGAEPLYSVLKTLHVTTREQNIREGILVVGPEGDFTAEEHACLVEAGVLPVGLGERRLRTETAAVALLSCMVGMGYV